MTIMEESIAQAPVFRTGRLVVVAEAIPVDIRPSDFGEGIYADPAVMESWRNRRWRFCKTRVHIRWADVVIATVQGDTQPHGHVAGEYVDSLSKQRREDGPAPLLRVVRDALGDARAWAQTLGDPSNLILELNKVYKLSDDFMV